MVVNRTHGGSTMIVVGEKTITAGKLLVEELKNEIFIGTTASGDPLQPREVLICLYRGVTILQLLRSGSFPKREELKEVVEGLMQANRMCKQPALHLLKQMSKEALKEIRRNHDV